MAALEWPDPPPADRNALRAHLDSLIEQVIDAQLTALETLDDQFARMAAALRALLDLHEPDHAGHCTVLETIHHYLNQPLTLVWWHELHRRHEPMPIDQVGAWLAMSGTPRPWERPTAGHVDST